MKRDILGDKHFTFEKPEGQCADCKHGLLEHSTMRGIVTEGITVALVPYCDTCERLCNGTWEVV